METHLFIRKAIHYRHFSRKVLLNLFKMVTSQFLSFTLLLDINEVHDELRVYDLPI